MIEAQRAAGTSLKSKLEEFEFFLFEILYIEEVIRGKHLKQDYPINEDLNKINFYYSAFLNSIQSLKDCCQTAMEIDTSWTEFSPTYGKFIFFCRNASTHDGSQLIIAGSGSYTYIVGPLQRLHRGKIVKCEAPDEEIATLCRNLASEILASVSSTITGHGHKILKPSMQSLERGLAFAEKMPFIPKEIRNLITENKREILTSMQKSEPVDYSVNANNKIQEISARLVAQST